jgi:Phosphotransferase enzyme family
VLPVDARRLRIDDPEIIATLEGVGVELVDSRPDVEIGPLERLRGDARRAMTMLAFEQSSSRLRIVRAAVRAVGSLRLRAVARRARHRMKQVGYPNAVAVGWDLEHALHLPGRGNRRRRAVELLPLRAIVLGTRGDDARTVLDAAVEAASETARTPLDEGAPVVRAAGLVVVGTTEVLRVAIGPARHELAAQREALNTLRAAVRSSPEVAERIPSPIAHGKAGLGDWSLESRIAGTPSSAMPEGAVLDECVDFLVTLHKAVPDGSDERSITANADVVAGVCTKERASEVRGLAARLEQVLADLPRGFAHGDFWGGNLLVDTGRLVGVVDWAGGGPGRLPLLDLLHLHVSASRWTRNVELGPTVVDEFLPWAQAGADVTVQAYSQGLGLDFPRPALESLVLAYWLDRVAYEIRTFRHRAEPAWVQQNVVEVLAAIDAGGYGRTS